MPQILTQIIPIIVLLLFATGVGATFYVIGTQVGGNDNASNVSSALQSILGINFALLIAFGLFNYFLFKSNPGYTSLYNTAMIYLSFFISFMAMSISLLDKTTA